jgi:hypothetical protein
MVYTPFIKIIKGPLFMRDNFFKYIVGLIAVGLLLTPLIIFYSIQFVANKSHIYELVQAMAWGLIIFEAFFAFGIVSKSFFSKTIKTINIAPSLGLAFVLMTFGWLNLFGFVNPALITVVMTFGALYLVWLAWANYPSFAKDGGAKLFSKPGLVFFVVLAILSVIWGYGLVAVNSEFNIHDDYHAYLYFPKKILDLGQLGQDPFSERRLISGLAGNSVLLAIGLSNMKWHFLHLVDWGLGILMISYLIFSFHMKLDQLSSIFLKSSLVIGICLFSNPAVNISSSMLPMAIIFAIWSWVFALSNTQSLFLNFGFSDGIFIGLMTGALLALKSTLIPYITLSVLLICIYFFVFNLMHQKQFFRFCFGAVAALLISVFAWSLDLYGSSGTPLYPILGRGYHATQYGYFDSATSQFLDGTKNLDDILVLLSPLGKSVFLLSFALLAVYLIEALRDSKRIRLLTLAALPLLVSITNCIIVGYALGGYGAYRYVYFVALVSLIISVLISIQCKNSKIIRFIVYLVCLFFLIRGLQDQFVRHPGFTQDRGVDVGELAPLSITVEEGYAELSQSLPNDGGVLLRVAYPFLLTAKPNVYLADYPAAASPPPGMPVNLGPEALKSYLLSHGIRYLVWDHQKRANFSQKAYQDRLLPGAHPWIASEARLTFDFQTNLELLRASNKVIFDKNGIAIIDLR